MIVEMYGRCDSFEVVYTQVEQGLWQTKVPADLADGMYVIEIWCKTNTGKLTYYGGILYMCDSSVVSLEIMQDYAVNIGEAFPVRAEALPDSMEAAIQESESRSEEDMTDIKFLLGEKKYIQFDIKSLIQQTVIVTEATYSLSINGEVEDEGSCIVEDSTTIKCLIEPQQTGAYILQIDYKVPPEVRKVRCAVNVY